MSELTHLDEHGRARMVDVGDKPITAREARASARLRMAPETLEALRAGTTKKGDALATARIEPASLKPGSVCILYFVF